MATSTQTTPAAKTTPTKTARKVVSLVDRTKAQLSTAALKSKITVDELAALEAHIGKLKSLLS